MKRCKIVGRIAILLLALGHISGCPEVPEVPEVPSTAAPAEAAKPAIATLKSGDMVTVVKVIKGDALIVEKDGKQATVRMLGIDSFHKKITDKEMTEIHKKVTAFLEKEILGKPVMVNFGKPEKDDRGRYLATVKQGMTDINRMLIEEGYVLTYSEFGFDLEGDYLQVEREARKKGQNIWGSARLSSLATERRRSWAEARKARGEKIPIYYFSVIAAEAEAKAAEETEPEAEPEAEPAPEKKK